MVVEYKEVIPSFSMHGQVYECEQTSICMHLYFLILLSHVHWQHSAEPDDYTFTNASFIFINGTERGGPGSQMCVDVPIEDDSLVEFDELFIVTADSPDPNINTTLLMTAVIILDGDGKSWYTKSQYCYQGPIHTQFEPHVSVLL